MVVKNGHPLFSKVKLLTKTGVPVGSAFSFNTKTGRTGLYVLGSGGQPLTDSGKVVKTFIYLKEARLVNAKTGKQIR